VRFGAGDGRLFAAGVLAVARPGDRVMHLIVGPHAAALAEGVERVLNEAAV
jgi:hypothetical protein